MQRVAYTYNIVGYQQAINAIRGTGALNVIVCVGNNYDDDLSWWTSNPVTDPANHLARQSITTRASTPTMRYQSDRTSMP